MTLPPAMQGAWKTVKDIVADTVGPMGLLAIAAGSFVKASAGAALNAQRMAEALKASDGAERLKQQFEQLLGSASAAKKQVEMLAKVASGSAFTFESLADASKNLQVLTNGALNSEKALKKVQDVAAATGAPVDTMATAVADLYNSLKSGAGVEAASGQLKNMGAISGETAQKLQALNASGVGLATTWQVVEADLNKANGAASALGGTIAGLQQQLANIQQGSDTKIGEMFAEGEKAGYRAAIGFKKFTSAVEEANAGPWSALFGAINSIKEAVGGMLGAFAETGAVKTIFQALGVAAIAILGGINVTIVALIVQLGKFTAKLLVTRTAVAALSATAKGFAALWSGATIGLTAFVAVLATMIALGGRAASSVKELKDQIKEFNAESNKGTEKARGMVMTASSPEERDAAEKYLEEQITNTRSGIEQGKNDLTQAREDKQSLDPFRRKAGGINEVQAEGAIQQGEIALQGLIGLQEVLNQRARDGGITAFDQKRLEMAQRRAELEKEIAERARERVQASATPENAAKMAATQKEKAEKELKYAEEATKNRKEDDKGLDKASKEFQKSKQERDSGSEEYNAAVARNKELENSKEIIGVGAGAREVDINDPRNSRNKEYLANKEIIAKGAGKVGEGLDYSPLDAAVKNSVSESGKLQAEIAKREAMKQERADAIGKGDSVRRGKVEAEMVALVNPLTGKSEFENDEKMQGLQDELAIAQADVSAGRGGQDKVDDLRGQIGEYLSQSMGTSGQRLQTDLKTAKDREDTVVKTANLENANITDQQAKEAVAADQAATEAGQRKLNIQKQLNALSGMEGGEGKAAEAELGPEIEQLKKKLAATEALEAAERAYAEAQKSGNQGKIKEAEANLNQRRVDAMGAGFKDGDTSKSVNQELAGVNQILKLRQQEAAITEAAAKRRRDDLMNEIKAANMINQIRVNRLDTKMGNSDANGFNEKKIAEQQQKTNNAGRGLEVAKTVEKLDAQIGGLQDKLKANPDDEEAKSQLDLAQKSKATFEATLGKMFPSGDVSVKGMQKNLDQERKNLEQVKNAPKTERDVQRDELKRQGGDLERAKGAAEERDAAIKAMDGATSDEERKRLSDVAAKKKEEMTSLGVDEGASVQSISKKISQNKQDQQNMLGEDVVNRASVEQDLKLTIARTKEDYGVTREDREQGRKERKDLEDVETKKSLKEQYERMGYKGGKDGEAEKLAEFDTKRKRLQADADEAGNSRVDSFTAIGGGATNSVGVVKDIQKEILDINKKQEDLLTSILKESLAQKALVQGYQPDSPGM